MKRPARFAGMDVWHFRQDDNRRIIERLEQAGVRLKETSVKALNLPLSGKEFVVTGRLESYSRQEAEAKIKELGGTAKGNVTKHTSYVVVGADPGSKLTRAHEMGIEVLDEEGLKKLLGHI